MKFLLGILTGFIVVLGLVVFVIFTSIRVERRENGKNKINIFWNLVQVDEEAGTVKVFGNFINIDEKKGKVKVGDMVDIDENKDQVNVFGDQIVVLGAEDTIKVKKDIVLEVEENKVRIDPKKINSRFLKPFLKVTEEASTIDGFKFDEDETHIYLHVRDVKNQVNLNL